MGPNCSEGAEEAEVNFYSKLQGTRKVPNRSCHGYYDSVLSFGLGVSYIKISGFLTWKQLRNGVQVKSKINDIKNRATGSSSMSGTLWRISRNMETRVVCASNSVRENAYYNFPSRWFKVSDELFRWNLSGKEAVENEVEVWWVIAKVRSWLLSAEALWKPGGVFSAYAADFI